MKRRVLSFMVALTLCVDLCPVWAFAADEGTDSGLCPHHPAHTDECGYDPGDPEAPCTFDCQACPVEDLAGGVSEDDSGRGQDQPDGSPAALGDDPGDTGGSTPTGQFVMNEDKYYPNPYDASSFSTFNTNGHTYTYEGTGPAIVVTGTGKLYLKGIIVSSGSGIEVQSGGFLSITETEPGWETSITGNETMAYALKIAPGAEVHLSTGTYSGKGHAIQVEGDDLAALLEPGCAYFDGRGTLLLPADAVAAKVLVVGQCTGHSGEKTWAHAQGATEHSWTCPYCGTVETEKCTFAFDENGTGACARCRNTVAIEVNESDLSGLVYDGTVKPEDVDITVTLTDPDGSGKELVKDTDYTVKHDPKKDAGEDTITVTGVTFNGTFTKTYHVEPDTPGIRWDETAKAVDYNGAPVTGASLPHITITIRAEEDLHPYLQYSYRKADETEFTAGLPTNAGTYEVKAYIPESQNYTAAETETLLALTINKIPAVATAPTAKTLTYNRQAQQLVTAGTLKPGAIAEGAVIEYKVVQGSQVSPYSTEIPTGIDVSGYSVYYRVSGTDNYTGVSADTLIKNPDTKYTSARINHKEITPTVELSYYTTVYDGGDKEPTVTVKDGEDVILSSEYTVAYTSNRDVGTAKVKVTNKVNGNYIIKDPGVTVEFKITRQPQAALTITQKPNTVIYGDQFTLGTQGGSGGGHVTWTVVSGQATVNPTSGQVKVTGHGTITVKAVKSGTDPDTNQKNYEDAAASWEFEADLRPVTATVTAEDKDYGETYGGSDLKAAKVHAVVEQGVLPGDEITITGLTGTFSDENAGVNKTVTVDTSGASIGGTNYEHYAVTYSSAPVKATIHKAVVQITTPPVAATLTYSGEAQALVTGAVVDTAGVDVEYALSESGPYDTAIPKGINAGVYTVWFRVRETDNYTGLAADSVDVTINKKPVAPVITLSETSYVYDGNAKEPTVTLHEADGTTLIPADQYTVKYSNNVNVGTSAAVTVTAKTDGNYTFTNAPVTKTFEIKEEQAKVLAAPEAAGDPLTFANRALKLVTTGTAYGGTMVYWVDDGVTDVADAVFSDQIPTGTEAKDYKVHYKVAGDDNHSDSDVGSVTVTIAPKTVTAIIELSDPSDAQFTADGSYTYDGTAKRPTVVVMDGSTVIDPGEYSVVYRNNTDAGEAVVSINDKTGGNYVVSGSTRFDILKADIVFTINPADAEATYNGDPQELLKEGAVEGGTVQYALGSKTGTYGDAIPTATNAGTYTVWYRVIGDKNHNDFAATSVTATIKRKPLTAVTIELSPTGFAYDGGVKLPAVAVKDGNTVLPEGEYDWSCNVASPTNVGTYTITISDAANGNYDLTGVTNKTATFTIGKVPQDALVIGGKPAATNYGDSFKLSVTGGSGDGAVTWNVTGPATVTAGNVTIAGVGDVTITVEKAADTNYLAAQAEWSFTAAPRPVEAVVTVSNKPYDGSTSATVATASIAVISGDIVIIDPSSITAVFDTPAVGEGKTVTLDASKVKVDGADKGKYTISYPETVKANITQADTEITTDPAGIDPLTYNGQPQALVTAGKSSVGFIVYSLDGNSFSPEIPTGTNAGTYSVYYKVDGTADYTGVAVNETPITVTIAPKSITPDIEVKESSYLYDGTKKDPAITVKDGDTVIDRNQYTVTWANTDSTKTTGILTDAGTYKATITNVNSGNYSFTANAQVEIVAGTQGSVKITGKPDRVCYGDTITALDTTGGVGNGTVKWTLSGGTNSTINENTGVLEVKDTGELTVKVERIVPNYATVSDTWTFTVEPKPVTAEVTVADKVYDGGNTAAVTKAEVNAGDLVNEGDTITITGLKGTFDDVNAGTGKTVTLDRSDPGFSITADTGKYTVTIPATATANITPRPVTVSVTLSDHDLKTDDDSGAYFYTFDGTEKRPAVTVTGTDETGYSKALAASDYGVEYKDNKNAGTATVTVTAKAGGNYTFEEEEVNFTIKNGAAVLTETPKAKELTYDGTPQDLVNVGSATGGTVVYSLTKEETADKPYSEAIPQGEDAGTYTVYYKVRGDGNHDDTATGQVSVTIRPREITPIIALSGDGLQTGADGTYSYVYDGSAKKPTVTVKDGTKTIDGPDDAKPEYTVTYQDNTNAGTAKVIVSDNNGGNYIVNGTVYFEIATAASTFTTTPAKKDGLQYNGTAQELVAAGGSGHGTVVYSLNGGNWSTAIPTAAAVDTYTVSYKIQGDINHADTTPVDLTVEIAKNTVNSPAITLSPEGFRYNGIKQEPTVTVYDDDGLLIPKHEYSVAITGTNGNNGMVEVDTYTVTVTTPASSNYVIAANNTRTFEIVPANQETISITGTKAQVRYGDAIQLGTTGGTGSGTVTWTVTDADGGAVNSDISNTGLLTVKDVGGPIKVTVTCAADNYNTVSATWEFSAAKKPVTAIVTADDKAYDGVDPATAVIHVTWKAGDLVGGDTINTDALTGTFDNPNVGQNKTVTIAGGPISDTKYEVTIPATTTASITAVAAAVDAGPTAKTLTYDAGQSQELVTGGSVTGGILVYSMDRTNFSPSIPKGKDAGTYTVWFKAQGDGNHTDSAIDAVSVTIGKQNVAPQVKLTPSTAKYDGEEHTPTVTLWDGDNNVIPDTEYKVTYVTDNGENWTDKGDYTVKIENNNNGNYIVATTEKQFTISTTAQNPLEITNKPGLVYYGDTFTLSAVGGSGDAAITWSVTEGAGVVEIDANGFVTIKGTGPAVITATKPGGDNYDTATAAYPLNALKKPITAIVTADDKVYDESDSATIHVTWKEGDLETVKNGDTVVKDTINTEALTGKFKDPNVGQNKTVTISGGPISSDKYDITIPGTTTASITKADTAAPDLTANALTYTGSAQALVTGGDGNTRYSDSRDGVYSPTVPTGTNAGTYTVWYKELGDDNHNDSAPQAVTVTISRKELETPTVTLSGNDLVTADDGTYSYVYDGTEKKPTVTVKDGDAVVPASEYTVSYSNNKNVSTETEKGTVTITCGEGGNYTFDEQKVYFKITSAAARLTSSPQAKDLTYLGPGQKQELVTIGTAAGGHIEYKLGDGEFGREIPKGETAGTYTVTYKVVGEGNYASPADTWTVSVTIRPREIVSPIVTVTGDYTYDGDPQIPTAADIKVEDGGTTIPASEYTVSCTNNINAGTATVRVTNANGGNYIVNGTGTFTIGKADVSDVTAPAGKTGLKYNGAAQALATAGSASGGTMVYALSEDGAYSPAIPTGTEVKEYTVWYKVQGDGNHNDTAAASVTASIVVNEVEDPTVQVTPEAVTWNGEKQKPIVTIIAGDGHVIDGSQYTVKYADAEGNAVTEPTNVGKYTLTIAGKADGNYSFTATGTFEILPADQTPLTITGQRERVCYGDKFQLGTTGGSDGGTIAWKVEDGAPAAIDNNGLLTITGVGSVKVTATSSAPGYSDKTATWSFHADKKPVTAVVTAESKDYDGNTDAEVTATLNSSDLVSGDEKVTITLAGSFEDANAGADKKVKIDSENPVFPEGKANIYDNYSITYPATATASIFKADIAAADVTAPGAKSGLAYTGLAQALVAAGSVKNGVGTLEYSTDNITYSAGLPTGTDAGDYDVWYRVKGDGNHNDTDGTKLAAQVTIARQEVETPTIELKPAGASYDGAVHQPEVVVKDKNGRVIPDSEYTFAYGEGDWKAVGKYKVKITDAKADGGNYDITQAEAEFEISWVFQSPLTITNQPSRAICYGDTFTLSAVGGSGTGTILWGISGPAGIDQNGTVKVTGSGSVTVTATKQADGNYAASTATWTFSAEKKPAKAIVTAKDKVFDSTDEADLVITWRDGDLVGDDTIDLEFVLTGKFTTANVGDNKTVTISGTAPDNDKYAISFNRTTTASITPAAATVAGVTAPDLTYNGQPQPLLSGGTATNGELAYSRDGANYTLAIPKEKNAGTYQVWYKAQGSGNYKDSPAVMVPVTIAPRTVNSPVIELSPEVCDYDGSPKKPDVTVKDGSTVIPESEYTVRYSNNTNAGAATVTISNAEGGNYIVSGSANFTIRSGAATLTSAPQERELTYTGRAQALVTPGSAVNGHLEYSLDGGPYSMTIPKGTDADEYFVYYKVVGDNGYGNTTPQLLIVTIEPKVVTPTIKVGGKVSYSTPYTGEEQVPDVTVVVEGKTLTEADYYIVGYSDNTDPGTATVTVASTSTSNYQFYADATFVITKVKAEFLVPPRAENLVYTGEAQSLVKAGMAKTGGTVAYSLDGRTYTPSIPKGTEVGDYVVIAKVLGDDTYTDSDIVYVDVSISRNTIAEAQLDVTLSANSFKYTGGELKPTVTVRDGEGNIISASEYSVIYSNNIDVGQADVTVTSTTRNYSFSKTVSFTITDADAPGLKITGQPETTVYYGDTLKLSTTGGSGTVTWSVEDGSATSLGGGRFEVKGSGSITVKANDGSSSDTWTFYADPKPVTAIVTAADKTYDNGTTATLTVTISGLVSGDSIGSDSVTATGQFVDANVGTNKTVIITGFSVSDAIKEKYDISYPATITASITPAPARVTDAPQKVTPLTYNGSAQPLVTAGTASNGRMMYSLDGTNYGYDLPTGTDAKTYTVWYKAAATDKNHEDSEPDTVTGITIGQNTDAPKVICTPDSFQFDGTAKAPASVVVWDSASRTIPESEYAVSVTPQTEVGTYTVTVTDKPGGNYEFSSTTGGTFKIETGSQSSLTIVTELYDVYYGDSFRLSATGGSGDGAIVWSIAKEEGREAPARISVNGVVTVTGTGGFTVQAYRDASDGYGKSNTVSLPFEAHAKPVTPVVTAEDDKPYDGKTDVKLTAKLSDSDLVGTDQLVLTVEGAFTSADVGNNKRVNITKHEANGTNVEKYDIRWPDSTTASIYKVDAQMENAPRPNPGTDNKGLTYKKDEAQALVTGGTTVGGIGTIVYSTSRDGAYSTAIPTGTDAGTYSVWYKVADSVNYTGIPAAELKVEIKKADPVVSSYPTATGNAGDKLSEIGFSNGGSAEIAGTFAWADGDTEAEAGVEYDVIFTPNDLANYNPVTIKVVAVGQAVSSVPSSRPSGPSSIPSAPAQTTTTIQSGTASTVVSTADGSRLVQSTKASQSRNAVIKPEITGDVTKTEVSIPSSTVRQLGSETDADLTVSSPIGDVTIPNGALGALSSAGGTVGVATEQTEQGVTLAVTAGGRTVEDIPGGVTLAVPAEDAGPGTVAVLVHEDGTRETVRRSVVDDGVVSIPLSGSATVEIVDNSKDFDDVSPESWAADAVDFASAHELFGGTSATTFSPDLAMSRGMLATVLYRLEGNPELDVTEAFSDVNSDAWYAEGVAWAAENGIAGGYGDGQFGPNDDITREQFVVMLWRYAGRPEAGSRTLDFVDADQVSGFALEALCWAVENGILRGVGNGVLDPGGTATRAQAAQLLKNFMENT